MYYNILYIYNHIYTVIQANRSQHLFKNGRISLVAPDDESKNGKILSKLSISPAYAVEVRGLPQDASGEPVVKALTEGEKIDIIRAERSATVKFKKHSHVRNISD